ncbi:MAG: hypothetical protein C0418_00010 [Coriobacteriaceae bacterium]|nr:hypothetical protein [Coriobacteriaceae bacterium]
MAEVRAKRGRPVPRTLRGRLSLVVLTGSIAAVAVVAFTTIALSGLFTQAIAAETAAARLGEFRSFLAMKVESADIQVLNYAEWDDFYVHTSPDEPPSEQWMTAEVSGWLPTRTEAETIAWLDRSGRIVYSTGEADDVRALVRMALGLNGGSLRGPIGLSHGPAVASIRPVTGWPSKPYVGYVAIAQYLSPKMLDGFVSTTGARGVSASPAGERVITSSDVTAEGWGGVEIRGGAGEFSVTGELAGPGGEVVGLVTVRDADPMAGHTMRALALASLLVVGLTLAGGVSVNALLRRMVSRPVDEIGTRVRVAVETALSGAGYTPLQSEPGTPEELRTTLEVVDALIQRLAARQTELERAADEARAAEERLRIAVDDSTEAKVLVIDGVVRLANPAAAALFGRPVGEMLGRPAAEALGTASVTTEAGTPFGLAQAASSGDAELPALMVEVEDRAPRWVEARVVAHPEQGEYLITARDVTEPRRLGELREEVLQLVSHDLKSPLSVIAGYLDILETRAEEATRAKAIDGARRGTQRMNALLDDLVNTTRADELFAPRSMAPVRIDRLAEDVVASFEHTTRHPLRFESGGPCVAYGDERRLRQALVNLVTNAIKYSPELRPITVGVREEGPHVLLHVEDEGPGVPEADRLCVFERFYRADVSEGRPGIGLGLYIVRAIVTAHGGTVRIEDPDDGAGSRFVIELPRGHAPERDGD